MRNFVIYKGHLVLLG